MNRASFISLKSHFLMAMPRMVDATLASSLIIICEHNPQGALGITVNRPTNLRLEKVFQQLDIEGAEVGGNNNQFVYSGGSVSAERGFVLSSREKEWSSCLHINNALQLTTSKDVLVALSQEQGPINFLLALGYVGWGAGQLERELANNIWLHCEADSGLIFNTPPHLRLAQAASSIGVDLGLISSQVGHA